VKAVELGVIAGVDDSDYLTGIDRSLQAGQHPGSADASTKYSYHEPAWPMYLTTDAIPVSTEVHGFHPK
jgi:hypothetical protein